MELLGPLQTFARKPEVASRTNKRVSSLRRILRQPSLIPSKKKTGSREVHVVSSKLRKQTPPLLLLVGWCERETARKLAQGLPIFENIKYV